MSTESTLSLDDLVQRAARLRERAGVLGDYLRPAGARAPHRRAGGARWGRPASGTTRRARPGSRPSTPRPRGRLNEYRRAPTRTSARWRRWPSCCARTAGGELDAGLVAELAEGLAAADGPLGRPGGGAPLLGRARRRRRAGDDQRGRGRHRRPGLGRDAAAHVPALGRAARPRGPTSRRSRRAPRRASSRPPSRSHGAERLRPAVGRARRAPAGAAVAVRLGQPPPDLVRGGRRRAAGRATRWTSRSSTRT